jgi:hypothetical protein
MQKPTEIHRAHCGKVDYEISPGLAKWHCFKTWRMVSEEAGRYRAPINKFEDTLQAIIGLMFFRAFA